MNAYKKNNKFIIELDNKGQVDFIAGILRDKAEHYNKSALANTFSGTVGYGEAYNKLMNLSDFCFNFFILINSKLLKED